MGNGDLQTVRRLLRDAFSEILTLSDRVVKLEDKSSATQAPSKRNVDVSGVVDLTTGATFQQGVTEGALSALNDTPLLQTKVKFGLPVPETECEMTIGTSLMDHGLKLKKVLFRGNWLGKALGDACKIVFCPIGGNCHDIMPTLNPNADEGLSKMMREGCPVHHQCRDAIAYGCGITEKGNMFATGVFLNGRWTPRKTLTFMAQGIISPTENLTFGLFFMDAFQSFLNQSGESSSTTTRPRFGALGSFMNRSTEGHSTSHDSTYSNWTSESIRFGSLGAWNIDDEYVLSGWLSLKNLPPHYRQNTELDSCGVAFSTFPYANTPTRKLAFQLSNARDGRKYAVECSSKYSMENGMEVYPGSVVEFSTRGVAIMIGIKTLLKF